MKAILEFDLNKIEDQEDFKIANKANNYRAALSDIFDHLRGKIKYGSEEMSRAELKVYEKIREDFLEILQDNDADFEN